jgi:hypothetical protein
MSRNWKFTEHVGVPAGATGTFHVGDQVGAPMTFEKVCDVGYFQGTVAKVLLVDDDKQCAALDLHLFKAPITGTVSGAAYDPTDAQNDLYQGVCHITSGSYGTGNDNTVAMILPEVPFMLTPGNTSLYGILSNPGPATPVYGVTGSVTVILTVDH